jgi:prolyl oligopeptidase
MTAVRPGTLAFLLCGALAGPAVAQTAPAPATAPAQPAASAPMTRTPYPPARLADVADVYHGTRVADPYRWLEDADSPETQAWVRAQNERFARAVAGPTRDALVARIGALIDYPRTGVPTRRGARHFFAHNTGRQNQPVQYWSDGPAGEWKVLIDPNALSADGTAALTGLYPSEDGARVAYAVSRSGSDLQEIQVRDVASGKDLPDRLQWAKFVSLAWLADGSGFYYTRFPEPGTVPAGEENYGQSIYFHRLGEPQARDAKVFAHPTDKGVVFSVDLTAGDRYLVIAAVRGASDKGELYLLDRRAAGAAPLPVFRGFDHAWIPIDSAGGRLFLLTDFRAPMRRLVALTLPDALRASEAAGAGEQGVPAIAGATLTPIVPEAAERIEGVALVRDRLALSYLKNASSEVRLFDLAGTARGRVELPAIGSITELNGRPEDRELFLGFTSYTFPATPFRFDLDSGALAPWGKTGTPGVDPKAYEVSQVWYPSKDGTKVSMFLVHKAGLAMDGQRPTLLYGYGGFDVSLTPAFSAPLFAWLERGGVFAVANLRGGGEYGEAWHTAGMLDRKQNVFDDFIAAAEALVARKITSPRRLAIRGGSNGGLLTGAVLVQRPELFGAVVSEVPVADMLRYHLFTVGRFWIPEYGSSEDPAQFKTLLAYSPLHNVKDGVAYPATLVTTADTDDRVAPGMAKKFAARLQAATAGPAPIFIRVETKAGHGAGKPIGKIIEEQADIYAFLLMALGAK